MRKKNFVRRWVEMENFYKKNFPELYASSQGVKQVMSKLYREAGSPYGDSEAGMLRWNGENIDRKNLSLVQV